MEQLQKLKRRPNATKSFFRGLEDEEPEFLAEDEQEELIESLRVSNENANSAFKTILWAFSAMEMISHLAFAAYSWYRRRLSADDHSFQQSASPTTGTLCSLISFSIGMTLIKDSTLIRRDTLAAWTFASLVPVALMFGTNEFSFEWLWWSMPLLLQIVDLTCLWIMLDPEEELFGLEKSQYKLKGA
ncbi:hypothetical protein EMPS_10956 [Entomortierella parvispora]|uniref:Transmembrane protein n=1 Tax=Entomortierella parvispora TaxID=205924 RepID=A0A9P3HL01_9FUNG|nr:hypothetical protein EMPS_10956 [Entomortierella parvispora]